MSTTDQQGKQIGMTFQQKVQDLLCFYRSKCHNTEKFSPAENQLNYRRLLEKLEDLAYGHHVVAPKDKRVPKNNNRPCPDIDCIPS